MNVEQLLRAIEKLRERGLMDHHLITLQVFQEKPSAVAEATLDAAVLCFKEDWHSTTGGADEENPIPSLVLVACEDD